MTDILDMLKTKPWDHQMKGIEYGLSKRAALLHMHMGTGKTKVVLDIAYINNCQNVLIICPVAVLRVWPKEMEKHYGGEYSVSVLDDKSMPKKLEKMREHGAGCNFKVINYESCWRSKMGKEILSKNWDMLVFDESHRIKSHGGKASKFCAKIQATKKLALTGTPMPHSPLDIFGQYRALDINIFGRYWTPFKSQYAVCGGPEGRWIVGTRNIEDLGLKTNSIRYEVKDDALDLPPMTEQDIVFPLDKEKKNYREMEELFITEVRGGDVTASNAMVKVIRLQQITSGYLPLNNDPDNPLPIGNSKLSVLKELLTDIGSEPVVIFCRFRHDISAIRRVCDDLSITNGEISGSEKNMEEWDRGDIDAMAVQMQSGSEGIDLTRSRYVIWYSMGFSRGQYDQANARCHRPGQVNPVTVYRLLADQTIDTKIVKSLVKRKKKIDEALGVKDNLMDDVLQQFGELPF